MRAAKRMAVKSLTRSGLRSPCFTARTRIDRTLQSMRLWSELSGKRLWTSCAQGSEFMSSSTVSQTGRQIRAGTACCWRPEK